MMYYSGEYSEDKLKVLPGTAPTWVSLPFFPSGANKMP